MTMEEVKIGDSVTFKPGPKSKGEVTAEVREKMPGERGGFLRTVDAHGAERKIRPGSVRLAA